MLKFFKSTALLALCLTSLGGCSLLLPGNNSDYAPAIAQGQKVPEVTLTNASGQQISLQDYAGKKVYINVWASWCGPCKREFPELEAAYQELKDRDDVVFLSVASPKDAKFKNSTPAPADETAETILKTAKDGQVTYPILFDQSDSFMSQFGIRSFPTHIIIASDGTLSQTTLGSTTTETLLNLINQAN